ncbi:GDP-fucose protein O-fucosyltransferase 2-like [Biomphalaria glabrata]|uniref:GDP-fucose protein O-fucosyltransferase 2 n=1 Tax=Biomphalaria glabrata TaxID=6526 RepID=A0A9W2ZPN5_BIOGL|nr:GDP-fucose protein O-fucosyltransferase 2-like [Biomphalaria glabrata]XP_055876928.1 GDP-fucose protein O-fucosyltransferase 2-like [Biomphalaria glabrata]XP_055876929.1 GDP-fucose protein O-fucosyltransferase 2-like [Biomphalaria glabrata]XP_055876930.1 GDP-fucose protein O-fucosyltransferase 2-like [Biomphalaria glabrata]XP_055876932.1 GDP-fucose protein O-fucosyltransferase 2-like [Biomphalaria glabrata]
MTMTCYSYSKAGFFIILFVLKLIELTYASELNDFEPASKFKIVIDQAKAPRYLLYDVNPGEGFNLRRDVYMRIAILARNLNVDSPWILVLPPWSRLYHWKSRDLGSQERISWSAFFDLHSLRRFVPVMEFDEFLKISQEQIIDEVYYLQHYEEGWDKWEEKMDIRPCLQKPYHLDVKSKLWHGWFYGYGDEVAARKFECMSVMGHAGVLKPFLMTNTTARSVMLDRAETVLHDRFGDSEFWEVRRSMRFSKELRRIADDFRMFQLDSTDEQDMTMLEDDWTQMKRKPGDAIGGPYLAVHLRRADFAKVREKDVPSIKHAAKQLKKMCKKMELQKIFVATDATSEEFAELKGNLKDFSVYRYEPTLEIKKKIKDGGVAIIDQWICAHARYFIGTRESTFSFRIQDEREILGFNPDTTFNRLCHEKDKTCEQPTRWTIKY